MNKRLRQVIQTLFFFAIGLALVYFQINNLPEEDKSNAMSSLRNGHWLFVGIAMFIGVCSHLIRALRWRLLLNTNGDYTSVFNAFYAVMIGFLANGFLPRFGEVIRCGVLSKKEHIPLGKVLGTMIAERIFDLLVLIVITTITIVIQFNFLFDFLDEKLFRPAFELISDKKMTIGLGLFLVLLILGFVYYFLGGFLRKISQGLFTKWQAVKSSFLEGFTTIFQLKQKGLFLGYSLLMWVCYFFMSYFVFFALDESKYLGIDAGLSVLTSGSLALVVPTPGGLGTYHYVVNHTLQLYNLSESTGITLSWLIWSANFAVILIFGLLSLLLITFQPDTKKLKTNKRT